MGKIVVSNILIFMASRQKTEKQKILNWMVANVPRI